MASFFPVTKIRWRGRKCRDCGRMLRRTQMEFLHLCDRCCYYAGRCYEMGAIQIQMPGKEGSSHAILGMYKPRNNFSRSVGRRLMKQQAQLWRRPGSGGAGAAAAKMATSSSDISAIAHSRLRQRRHRFRRARYRESSGMQACNGNKYGAEFDRETSRTAKYIQGVSVGTHGWGRLTAWRID